MKIIVSEEKITMYLLKKMNRNDKSNFLNNLGFFIYNWHELQKAIVKIFENNPIYTVEENQFGLIYTIIGDLNGINGKQLLVKTIWIKQFSSKDIRFVTLFPQRSANEI